MGSFISKQSGFDPAKDISDLTGKVIVVTGGNSGIGFATLQYLARQGAKVYLGARSEQKAKAAIERLHKEGLGPRNGEVVWLNVDLSDPRDAKKAAEEFLTKEKRLDVLGIEDTMMVNHISPFVFTRTLLPLLTKTAKEPNSDVRIVNVSSDAITCMMPDLARYGLSKLANALFTKQLQKKLDADQVPIIVIALHPGSVNTEGLLRDPILVMPIIGPIARLLFSVIFLTPSQGATAPVFAAAAPAVRAQPELYKAAFLQPSAKIGRPTNPDAQSAELAKELWDTTEEILEKLEV
ncbi:hypothetical protein A0H81_02445 [Grifola frondosa]|uniref:NAD-P-binding protein n=1 Tax=Grifola frondosa TaxID=5627 RepID=A0A1C7MN70_GRIFR|nr:hypothetical protein A0H81_02445 [Grifola frondosa]